MDGVNLDSEDALTLFGWIFEYLKEHPFLLELLVYSLVFVFVSWGASMMIRAWRKT